jgi:hypothetical protein
VTLGPVLSTASRAAPMQARFGHARPCRTWSANGAAMQREVTELMMAEVTALPAEIRDEQPPIKKETEESS